MKLSEVLANVSPVMGVTSVLAALIGGGDLQSVSGGRADESVAREHAATELARYRTLMNECASDAAYWGYLGRVEYWQMVVNLLDAAALVGADNLPDVPLPGRDGVVIDLLAAQSKFGRRVLELAKQCQKAEASE